MMVNSGPPYPPPPPPGSNQIGLSIVGVGQIGDIAPYNPWAVIIDNYANSGIVDGIVLSFDAAMDQTENFSNFFDNQWNPDTASGYGLDVIGRIVGVTRVLSLAGTEAFFGFQGSSGTGFNQAPFFTGGQLTTNYSLQDPDFLTLINAKMLSNICDGGIPAINALLLALFPNRGNCYVVDGQNMTMQYKFDFVLTAVEQAILAQAGVLPTPCGVAATIASPP